MKAAPRPRPRAESGYAMAIETGLEGKPWYISAAVGLLLAAGIVMALHWFWLRDMNTDLVAKEATLTGLQQRINEGRAAQARLPQFTEEVARLRLDLKKLLLILPPRRNTEDLLERIQRLTEQGDFDLLSFRPQSPVPVDFYSEWPIKIELEGSYHNLAEFFDKIGRFSRIINIDSLNISALTRDADAYHTIRADFMAKTFLYNEPESETEDEP